MLSILHSLMHFLLYQSPYWNYSEQQPCMRKRRAQRSISDRPEINKNKVPEECVQEKLKLS